MLDEFNVGGGAGALDAGTGGGSIPLLSLYATAANSTLFKLFHNARRKLLLLLIIKLQFFK